MKIDLNSIFELTQYIQNIQHINNIIVVKYLTLFKINKSMKLFNLCMHTKNISIYIQISFNVNTL